MSLYALCGANPTRKRVIVVGIKLPFPNGINPLSANPEKWSNTLKQIVGNLPTICLSVFDHFMNLALKLLILKFMLMIFKVPFFKMIIYDQGLF